MKIDLATTTLYSINQVCEKLGVSRSTLDRWRGVSKALGVSSGGMSAMTSGNKLMDLLNGAPSFPKPDTYLNGAPRWTIQTLNEWVNKNNAPRQKMGALGLPEENDE